MKRSLYSILFVILLAFTTVFFVSCNGGQTGDGDKSVPENVVLPDIEMAGGYTASITDGSDRTALCYSQGEGSPLTVIVTRTDNTGSEVAVSKEYYYRGVSDGGEYYLVIRDNGDKYVYANGYEYLYGETAYDRESFTFSSSDAILTEMNLAANPYVYDIFGGAGKASNLAKFKKYSGGVSQYRASGADLNSSLVPDTAVVDMWISSKGVVTRFRITDGRNVIVNVRYTKVGETDSPALPSDVELSKVCAHNFVWTPDENGTHNGVCTYDESHIVTGLSCHGGTATCVSGRKCDLCGGEYGDVDPDSHDFAWKSNGDGTHTEVCKRNREHKGKTEECRGGKATCTEKAVCEVCGEKYGEPLGHDFSVWVEVDKDYHKKVCSHDEKHVYQTQKHNFGEWTSDGNGKHYRVCETCNRREEAACNFSEPTCTEKAKCGVCGAEKGEPKGHLYGDFASNGDGTHKKVCSACGDEIKGKCTGGKATCVEKAKCDVCHGEYGEFDTNNHDLQTVQNVGENTHTTTCKRTGCTCSVTENCSGGKATCTEKATCKVCGGKYGEVDLTNHAYKWKSNGDGTHTEVCSRDESHKGRTENCSGGTANCVEKATCKVCGDKYGEINANNHDLKTEQNADGKTHTTVCGRKGCTYSKTENCSGGEATCTEKAICEVCGKKYGEALLKYEESGDGYILAGVTETGKTKLTENDLIVIANEYEGKKIIGISAEATGDIVANAKFAGISFENDNIETLDAGLFKEFIKGLADKEIKGLKLEKGIYLIGKVDGENFEAKWAIGSKGAEATLPENVNIAKGLFGDNAEITTVTVGKGVKLYDGILTEFGGNTLKIDFGNAFFNGKTTAALFNGSIYSSSMPYAEVVGDGEETYYVPMSLENAVVLNENVPAGAFRNMSMLKTVDLQNVKEIGERAFMGCSGITSVTLSENLEKINAYAFYGSSAITEITIPKSVKKVGTYAFGECGEITVTVEYDKGTDKRYNAIEASAFYKSVVTVKFGGTEADWKGFVKADWNYASEATVEYAA